MGHDELWLLILEDRQRKQVLWSQLYTQRNEGNQPLFEHGDTGHNDKIIISKMAAKLNEYESELRRLGYFDNQ